MPGRFLLILWSGGGNVNPFLALGAQLAARGHAVGVLGPADLAARFEADGFAYRAHPSFDEWAAAAADVKKPEAWARGLVAEVLAEVQRERPDVLVVDYMLPSALCAAESSGLPVVALVHTLYAPIASAEFDSMSMMGGVAMINALRGDLGLPRVERLIDLLDRTSRVFATAPLALDPAPAAVAGNVRYVGPLLEASGADARWAPPGGDGPLVVISLGTTPMDEAPVVQRVLDAVSEMPLRAVATAGDHMDRTAFDVPANARVERYVRHAAMLDHADLFVGHAGLGGVFAALSAGVPMVCLPLGRDQPMNAARVEAIGAGRTLPPDSDVVALRAAIASVLGDASYRRAARSVAEDIAASIERRLAVTELEGLLST